MAFGGLLGSRDTQPLAQLAWFQPTAQSFMILSALATAFLCVGRYRALGGVFTSQAMAWEGVLTVLAAVDTASSYRRYRREGDPMLGYVAPFLVLFAFGLLDVVVGGRRYDVWWYAGRLVFIAAYVALLFGFLQEGYALFRRQRELSAERERLLASERQARQLAESAVKMRDEFLSVAAHELKTPLTSLWGFSQVIVRKHRKEASRRPSSSTS